MKLLYYSPSSYGGIADYAHEQANALAALGVEVDFLCTQEYPVRPEAQYNRLEELEEITPKHPIASKLRKAQKYIRITLANYTKLSKTIREKKYKHVLLGSYSEYLAPLWAGKLHRLAVEGVVFGAVVHDPIRDFVFGSPWWHRWSIASAYSFLREAFVHSDLEIETVRQMPQLSKTIIPHGSYNFPSPSLTREEMRSRLNLPQKSSVILAFGHLRENKNLDLIIRAMASVPEVYLVVAGSELSRNQNLSSDYRALAKKLDVNERIRWETHFIPEEEIGNFFNAADVVALTYSKDFRSASGVLNTAAQYQKFCIASGGDSCLASVFNRYHLGIWIEPDDSEAIVVALNRWLSGFDKLDWSAYLADNSWNKNAELTLNALDRSLMKN